jgi:macrodomain Ter protein organizer (MatP/YcbG family)
MTGETNETDARMGRPPLPPEEKLRKRTSIRFRAEMWDWLERRAERRGTTVNQVILDLVHAKRKEVGDVEAKE